jgi:hypothetical protein
MVALTQEGQGNRQRWGGGEAQVGNGGGEEVRLCVMPRAGPPRQLQGQPQGRPAGQTLGRPERRPQGQRWPLGLGHDGLQFAADGRH